MQTPLPSPRWFANIYLWVALIVVGGLAVPFCTRTHSEWDTVYVRAATDMQKGVDIYAQPYGYLYPPFQMMLALPFTHLSPLANRLAWFAINMTALGFLIGSAWAISGGRPLSQAASWSPSEHAIFLLGLGCGIWYSLHALAHQQTDLVIAALVVGGCRFLQTGRSLSAGALFGLATAMKCTPLLLAPYLLARRRFAAALVMLSIAGGVNYLPELLHPSPSGVPWMHQWFAVFLRVNAGNQEAFGTWGSDILYNQSIAGAVNRWTQTRWSWSGAGVEIAGVALPFDKSWLRVITLGVEALLGLTAALLCCRRFRLTPEASPADAVWAAQEYGIVVLLMVLCSPMSSIPHFCTLILPGFCVARRAIAGNPFAMLSTLAAVGLAALSNKDVQGSQFYTLSLWHGAVTVNAVVLLLGLFGAMMGRKSPTCAVVEAGVPSSRAA